MAKSKGIRYVILVEDKMLERFVYDAIKHLDGYNRIIRIERCPGGLNAKQWVTRKYPIEVKAYRRKASEAIALLVGTDTDELTVQKRQELLSDALRESELDPRSDRERIVHWIPKWHIETWILYFSGKQVNESERYKRESINPDFTAVATAFNQKYREYRANPNIDVIPSLKTAFQETKRLD